MDGRELSEKRLLPFARLQGLLFKLLVETDYFSLQRAIVRFQGFQTAMVVKFLLSVGEHQTTSIFANPDGSVVTRFPHMGIHVFQIQHLVASLVPAFRRRVVAHLGMFRQMLQLHHFLATPGMIVTLYVQLQDQVFQWKDVVQLFGGDPLAFDRAAALLNDPRQYTASAEDVTARGCERIFQNFITQVAFEVWVHSPFETIQLKSHVLKTVQKSAGSPTDQSRRSGCFEFVI